MVNFSSLTYVYALSSSDIVSLANASRNSEGIAKLAVNSKLASAAYNKANDMLEHDYFAHTSPGGKTPWDFIKAAGYNYVYAGENLSIGYTDAQELHTAWMNSLTHRENIMNGNFEEIGIAVVSGEYEGAQTTVVVQMFGSAVAQTAVNTENTDTAIVSAEQQIEGEQSAEKTEQPVEEKINFAINKEKTKFSPDQLFAGEKTTFTVVYTGEAKTIIVKSNDKEIDLSENTKISTNNSNENVIEKNIAFDLAGDYQMTLVATDKNGNNYEHVLGLLKVADKEVKNTAETASTYKFKEGNQGKIFLYILASVLLVVVAVGGLFIYRYAKINTKPAVK